MPWTINNLMCDKYIIADNKATIIGGRNIADKYPWVYPEAMQFPSPKNL